MTKLAIVESPTKVKKVLSYLGDGWKVMASMGHVRDLPQDALGIDIQADFQPHYQVLPEKKNPVRRLVKAMREAEAVYIATDPDREGEAIGWHLLALAQLPPAKPVYRITFSAITRAAVLAAVANPRALDVHLVDAQQTRRLIDRLVGYLVSPLACQALGGSQSAGRVQSVCLRLVVDREREIQAFKPEPYWTLDANLGAGDAPFSARLVSIRGRRVTLRPRESVEQLKRGLQGAAFRVEKVVSSDKIRLAPPPFTTSTLQQAASQILGFSLERTMEIAQVLYEAGLITYHRTDSVIVAPEAQAAAGALIEKTFGKDYLPAQPPVYTTRTPNAQEAHEAIRPAEVIQTPEAMAGGAEGESVHLYALIWGRFIASQMAAARYKATVALIRAARLPGQTYPVEFQAQGRALGFDGFLKVYQETPDEGQTPEADAALPPLGDGQPLTFLGWRVGEHTTHPPSRYTEASLIQALEQRGIGRPSTYASTLKAIRGRDYVALEERRLVPTETGKRLWDFLAPRFGLLVMAYAYTANLETTLDQVAAGKLTRLDALRKFWADFGSAVKMAAELAPRTASQTVRPVKFTRVNQGV